MSLSDSEKCSTPYVIGSWSKMLAMNKTTYVDQIVLVVLVIRHHLDFTPVS